MAFPTAIVKVELLTLKGLPAASPGAGNTRYARATFTAGSRPAVVTGRSKPIPDAGGDFDLTPEAVAWSYEVAIEPGTDINIQVDLKEDHGDAGPVDGGSISGKISDPWKSGAVTLASAPSIAARVTTKLVQPTDKAFLARAATAAGVSGTLTVAKCYFVEILSIDGLYKPDSTAAPPNPGSKKVAGYISEDNLGRIFTNRTPDGAWAHATQFINVKAQVTGLNGALIPNSAKLTWTITDVDDPTNDEKDFHREWGRYVDPNDYDGSGNPIGAHAGDNTGAFSGDVFAPTPANGDPDNLFAPGTKGRNRWAQIPGGPVPASASANAAESDISLTGFKTGTSSVRIHCPNVGGTNFVLSVGLKDGEPGVPVFNAFTGVMTMWSRIDVEVARMPGAHTLNAALPKIPPFFIRACVQLDIQLEKVVGAAFDIEQIAGNNRNLEDDKTREWINNVFTNKTKPGWFFLGGARFASKKIVAGAPRPAPLFDGTTYTLGVDGDNPFVEVPGVSDPATGRLFTTTAFVIFEWQDAAGIMVLASFEVDTSNPIVSAGGTTRIFLDGDDFTPEFTGHDADGTIAHATQSEILLFPQHTFKGGALVAGGFGVPAAAPVPSPVPSPPPPPSPTVKLIPRAPFTTGISPGVKKNDNTFAGRTVVFTSSFDPAKVFEDAVLKTAVHEFTHAFGMPHKCGYFDWQTRRATSC